VLLAAHAAPRVAPVPAAERSAEQREIAARFASLGMANAVGTYLRYPALATAILPYTEFLLTASTLPPRDREILWLRTAWLARSSYMWAHRVPVARRIGLSANEITSIAIGPDDPQWDSLDVALLRAADELHVDAFISNATWELLAEHYNANQLIDLVYGVGEIAMHADVANTLRIEIEPGIADRLPSAVPYRVTARDNGWSARNRASHRCRPRQAPPPRMSSARSRAIHRPIRCATPSAATFVMRRRCCHASGSS
jgi:alkylhydroperoxidase family enzyme